MDSIAMVEELAWLIKDNLPSKHLVLSAEEMFIEFLEPAYSGEETLMLEPMISYHRMLLHRLADIFGLAHESIGEGDDRRLVVERCEDSTIPDVLVSDILECNDRDKESTSSQTALQLLKRNTDPSGVQKNNLVQLPQISLEERQAAYLAARERIFSEDWDQQVKESVIPRPRSVPVVARRMIAHALGKRILADKYSLKAVPNCEPSIDKSSNLVAATCPNVDDSGVEQESPPEVAAKVFEHSPGKAAKRMFAQALGRPFSSASSRGSSKQPESNSSNSSMCPQQGDGLRIGSPPINCVCVSDICNSSPADMSNNNHVGGGEMRVPAGKGASVCAGKEYNRPIALKAVREHEPGRAAQRMLAQALGFRSSSIVIENRVKSFDGGTFS